jgi:hypothetical protein
MPKVEEVKYPSAIIADIKTPRIDPRALKIVYPVRDEYGMSEFGAPSWNNKQIVGEVDCSATIHAKEHSFDSAVWRWQSPHLRSGNAAASE